jgi:molybdopterin-binding protein
MKISARNQLKGTIVAIQEGAVNAIVQIKLSGGDIVSATISLAAVKELGLVVGKEASAIIKATSVMVGVKD